MPKSRYTLYIENLSSSTRSADIRYEMERAGKVREVVRDPKARAALVEFNRADDAQWAWEKLDGVKVDGRAWKVDWATPDDFDFFRKPWTEGGSGRKYRSRSMTPSPSADSRPLSDQTPYAR